MIVGFHVLCFLVFGVEQVFFSIFSHPCRFSSASHILFNDHVQICCVVSKSRMLPGLIFWLLGVSGD